MVVAELVTVTAAEKAEPDSNSIAAADAKSKSKMRNGRNFVTELAVNSSVAVLLVEHAQPVAAAAGFETGSARAADSG